LEVSTIGDDMSAVPSPGPNAHSSVRVIAERELAVGEVAAWSALQNAAPQLASPFFRPEFTQMVADVRQDARVAIVEDASGAAAFFSFQAGRDLERGPCCRSLAFHLKWALGIVASFSARESAKQQIFRLASLGRRPKNPGSSRENVCARGKNIGGL
jgi:hypothetical protein